MAEKSRKMQSQGIKVIKLDIGEPDFDTPSPIVNAAIQAMKQGKTHYTPSKGIPELRESIANFYKEIFNVDINPENEIIITPGSKFALYSAIQVLVDKGDEVIILTPAWPTYKSCVKLAGGKIVEVPCTNGYCLNEEKLKEAITNKTKLLIVNSPNNPTGGVLSPDNFKVIVDLSKDHNFYVLSDEIYRLLIYDGLKPFTVLSLSSVDDNLIIIDGFSKAWAMTGWRLGFAIASKEIIRYMNMLQQNAVTCPTSFVQYAGIAALMQSSEYVNFMIKEYDKRRKFLIKELNSIDGIKCEMPKGAFYVFPDISELKINAIDFAEKLLLKAHVCTVPGDFFGLGGGFHIRISYATSMKNLEEGVHRIKSFIENELK